LNFAKENHHGCSAPVFWAAGASVVVALVLGHRGDAGRGEAQEEGAAGLVARGYRGLGAGSRHGG
jgi:hypothetical protein